MFPLGHSSSLSGRLGLPFSRCLFTSHGSSPAGGGHRFISSDGTNCLLIPAGAWWLRRERKEQGQCPMILPINTQPGFTFPASGNKEVQDFLICSYSELIAAEGVMLQKWDWCLCELLDSWPWQHLVVVKSHSSSVLSEMYFGGFALHLSLDNFIRVPVVSCGTVEELGPRHLYFIICDFMHLYQILFYQL